MRTGNRMEHYHIIAEMERGFSLGSKFVILPNHDEMPTFAEKARYDNNLAILFVSELVIDNRFLPASDTIFSGIEERIRLANGQNKTLLIFGLDALLTLWNEDNIEKSYSSIKDLLDDTTLKFYIFSGYYPDRLDGIFVNSRHKDKLRLLAIAHQDMTAFGSRVCILDNRFRHWRIEGQFFDSFQQFVYNHEHGLLEKNTMLFILAQSPQYPIPTINDGVAQIHSSAVFLQHFCGLNDSTLSVDALEYLETELNGTCENIQRFLQRRFFTDGFSQEKAIQNAPGVMCTLPGTEKELFLWMLRKSISIQSYLKTVLDDDRLCPDNFIHWYVCKALDIGDCPLTTGYARERKTGLHAILDQISGDIDYFIEQLKEQDDLKVCVWLNNDLLTEKREMLRRIAGNKTIELPKCILDNYLAFDCYMSPYRLGNEELNDYFRMYRTQKLGNRLIPDFYAKAEEIEYPPSGIPSRASLLHKYSSDNETALLVVDALGVEYMPAIIALACHRSLGLETASIAYANLPTSTQFNPIEWPTKRRCNDIKKLDEIIHNGAESQTERAPEDNLAALLDTIENVVIPEIRKALSKYKTLVLTSDHGASRLAVLAFRNGLSKNLAMHDTCNAEDWRYSPAIPGHNAPLGSLSNLAGDYWVVKGYNRFSKKGGKLNELHGGLTWEEVLVPVMVFRQGAVFKTSHTTTNTSEFENDSAFDEL